MGSVLQGLIFQGPQVALWLGWWEVMGGGILGTFVGCPENRHWLHLNWHIWKMNLISLHTVSVIHSLYVHLLSRSELKIRWMLNLYVNFNIEAILYLKNKINASISFLMWYWVLSLLGEKSFPNASSPNSNLRGQRSLGRGNFAFCWCSSQWYASLFPQYHLLSQCEGWIARVEGFFLNDNGVYLLIGFWEFAVVSGFVKSSIYPTGEATGLNQK